MCSLPQGRITYAFVNSARSHSLFGHIYPRALLSTPQQKDFPFSSGPFMLQFKCIMFSGHQTQGQQCLLFATDTYISQDCYVPVFSSLGSCSPLPVISFKIFI